MCYLVYLSTDSPKDLTERNSDLVRFEKVTEGHFDPGLALLAFPNQWYVGSKSGCSCTFRHLHPSSIALGFSEPEDWYPEGRDELDATRELYAALSEILSSGARLDLLDRWEGSQPEDITTLVVSFDQVSPGAFRLFESHKFILEKDEVSDPVSGK
ncbi:MAG: hypothetical protein HY892_05950 [Deltaproteobacteria bacterium]|nr:hypothetical protein [Deltaproteobacteria bacterium]